METENNSRRQFLKTFLASFSAFIFMGLQGCRKKEETAEKNPYEYDIEKFKKIDARLILYEEKPPLKVKQIKGLAIDSDGNLFVAGNKRVYVFSAAGKLLKSFKTEEEPHCVASGGKSRIFIGMKDHVEVYRIDGKKAASWSSLGEKAYITSVSVNDDRVVVADYGNKLLWLFNKEGKLLKFIKTRNESNHIESFRIPSPYFDVNFDTEGNIWAVNPGRHRLELYSPDGTLKTFWGKASMEIDGFAGCCNPTHFTILPGGDIVTAEKGLVRVKVYTKAGALKAVVAGPYNFREGTTGLSLAADSKGNIYVADPVRKQVRIFALKEQLII